MEIKELFENDQEINRFYSRMASIAEMAVSKHANLLLTHIIQETAKWAYEHRNAIEKLEVLGCTLTPEAAKPECAGALDEETPQEQGACRTCQDSITAS